MPLTFFLCIKCLTTNTK